MTIPFKPADPTVDGFIMGLKAWLSDAATRVRAAIHAGADGVQESIKKREAHFDKDGPICFIKAQPTHVNLVFVRGTELTDPAGLLKGYQDKMKTLRVTDLDRLDDAQITAWVEEAVKLNQGGGE